MDIATIIGILSGIGLIIGSILMNSGLDVFVSLPSFLIVFGGTIAATLISYPLKEFLSVIGLFIRVFIGHKETVEETIEEIVELSQLTRSKGVLAIEKMIDKTDDEFLSKGIQMLVDGKGKHEMQEELHKDTQLMIKEHRIGWEIFGKMGSYSPAFGMIGTLIGLIQMLADLNDPGSIGPKMAVALITTFYGTLFANLLFLPMSHKLKRRSAKELHHRELLVEGLIGIRDGENPKILEERLAMFSKKSKDQEENEQQDKNE